MSTLIFVATMLVVATTAGTAAVIFESPVWFPLIGVLYAVGLLRGTSVLNYAGISLGYRSENGQFEIPKCQDHCRVCGGDSCNRHGPSLRNDRVKVPKDFDDALQNLLERSLRTYVCAWYANFSANSSFVREIRLAVGTAVRDLAGRLLDCDVSKIIFDDLVPVALRHAKDWRELVEHCEAEGGKPEDRAVGCLGRRIHPAAYSRDSELNYLRGVVTALLPRLLPSAYLSANNRVIIREVLANWVLLPAIDALADPDNVNTLVELCTRLGRESSRDSNSVRVPILGSWVTPILNVQGYRDPLKPSLEDVLDDPRLLYLFMQHIKETGPVDLLQFCLDIDDLSKRMLDPEITTAIEEILYTDALNIYSTYLDPDGCDYLHLPAHISQGMREILEGGPGKIQELRTSRPLYQAHQEAHALLEAVCLPSFHHSYEVYKLLCGQSESSTFTKPSGRMSGGGVGGAGVGARLSNQLGRIRGALRAAAVDGAPFHSRDVFQAEEVDCSPPRISYGEVVTLDGEQESRDLTTWRATIPRVDGGGAHPLYTVAVRSAIEDKSWTVLRRDQDFYVLRTRLTEFHGDREFNDSPLPARKNPSSLVSNRQRYQDFLQKLLGKPSLRSSRLLYAFLTSSNFKPYLTNPTTTTTTTMTMTTTTPDIGVLCQSMAHKLRKEKGQHLDKFMTTFLLSTGIKTEHTADLGVEPFNDRVSTVETKKKGRDLRGDLPFGNNLDLEIYETNFVRVASKQRYVKGACCCIAEAVVGSYGAASSATTNGSSVMSHVVWLAALLSRTSLDPLINEFLRGALIGLLSDGRAAANVAELLENTIFSARMGKTEGFSDSEKKFRDDRRYARAKQGLHDLLPWWCLGFGRKWRDTVNGLLDSVQSPSLNKHLAYTLLDQIVANLYPEISS